MFFVFCPFLCFFVCRAVVQIFSILGNTFPVVAVYFLDVIIVKTLAGLTFEVSGQPVI